MSIIDTKVRTGVTYRGQLNSIILSPIVLLFSYVSESALADIDGANATCVARRPNSVACCEYAVHWHWHIVGFLQCVILKSETVVRMRKSRGEYFRNKHVARLEQTSPDFNSSALVSIAYYAFPRLALWQYRWGAAGLRVDRKDQ